MNLWNWIKDKYAKRRDERDDHDPWWVTLMLDIGRPAVAIMILTACAPGEHYLGVMAGWSKGLAWLTPASLTAYAGISAVVATKRPQGAPGRKTAVWGAVMSILLAMAAQPVAHLYEQHLITGHRFVLTIVVSVIPAAVFGHLLHLGAAPSIKRRTGAVRRSGQNTGHPAGQSTPPVVPTARQSTSAVTPPTGQAAGQSPVRRTANGSMRSTARDLLTADNGLSNDDLMTALLSSNPGSEYNTRWKSISRARKDLGIPA